MRDLQRKSSVPGLELPATAFSQHVITCSILAADVHLTRLLLRSTIIALPLHRQHNTTQHWTTALHTRSTGEGSLSRAQYHATSSTWVLGRRGYTLSFSTREGRENLVAVSRRLVTTVWFVVPAYITYLYIHPASIVRVKAARIAESLGGWASCACQCCSCHAGGFLLPLCRCYAFLP